MRKEAIALVLGIAIGTVGSRLMISTSQEDAQSPALPTESSSHVVDSEPDDLDLLRPAENDIDSGLAADVVDESGRGVAEPAEIPVSGIPSIYEDVIGEPRPKSFRAADRHAIFLTESRDEVWASAMESGIGNYVSDNASNLDVVVEYFECRSEHCEIAGYAPPGTDVDINQLKNGLRSSGWWMGGQSSATTSETIDGVDRFVIIFNRDVIWYSR